jgi:hypothetical protein
MYGLEYALFFGVPSNKLELINGFSHWSFPFASRELAEAHFTAWLETLCRWKQIEPPPAVRKSRRRWQARFAGIRLEVYPRPIRLEFPIDGKAFRAFLGTFNRRDFWPGQPAGLETGWDSMFDEGDIRMNLWSLFRELCDRHGGDHSSRCDIALSDSAAVAPDSYYYRAGRENIMIGGDYFCAAPDVIAEVLTAPSRAIDRGQRMELYRRAGVARLWLLEPARETIEVYDLRSRFELQGCYGLGESCTADLFPGERIAVDALFRTQSKRHQELLAFDHEREPIAEWILPPEFTVGLEYFFHLGHPERRWEFWGNKAHSVLAFGSPAEATARLEHFVTEACRWEALPKPSITRIADDTDQAELGRFQLTRRGRLVFLDVTIDGRRYKDLLRIWNQRDAWDWGEEKRQPAT